MRLVHKLLKKCRKWRFAPFVPSPKHRWLKNSDAAEALAISVRTLKLWMTRPATRKALGAVRHGEQWRIPWPEEIRVHEMDGTIHKMECDPFCWANLTRDRFEALGIPLSQPWERDIDRLCKRNDRYLLESCRLWLAAYAAVLGRGSMTQDARDAILRLFQTACEILDSLPRQKMELEKLKSKFPDQLRSRNTSQESIYSIMSYWPKRKHFKLVCAPRTLDELETIRRRLDYTQAVRDLEQSCQKLTGENLRPLLHKDIFAHINDTREKLAVMVMDFREPQDGLPPRTFQNRHPKKQQPQRDIIAGVYRTRSSIPGAVQEPHTGKTPIRGPTDDPPSSSARLRVKR